MTDQHSCRIDVTWDSPDASQTITLDLEPDTVCDSLPAEQSDTLEAEATCIWSVRDQQGYDWEEAEPLHTTVSYSASASRYRCEDYGWLHGGNELLGYSCQDNPEWKQPPSVAEVFEPVPPGEEGFTPTQLVERRIPATDCEWREWTPRFPWVCIGAGACWTYGVLCRLDDGWHRQRSGRYSCQAHETYAQWNGVLNCTYEQETGRVEITADQMFTIPLRE